MAEFNMSELDADDVTSALAETSEAVGCIESCETVRDVVANIDDAIVGAKRLLAELNALRVLVSK